MAGDYGDLMAKLIEAFEGEAEERIQELNRALLALEQASDPGEIADLIKVIFREAHTLKGTAGGLGLKTIERLGHSMETVFGLLRAGEISTSAEMFDVFYKSLDAIGELAKSAARGLGDTVDVGPLVDSLNLISTNPQEKPDEEKPATPAAQSTEQEPEANDKSSLDSENPEQIPNQESQPQSPPTPPKPAEKAKSGKRKRKTQKENPEDSDQPVSLPSESNQQSLSENQESPEIQPSRGGPPRLLIPNRQQPARKTHPQPDSSPDSPAVETSNIKPPNQVLPEPAIVENVESKPADADAQSSITHPVSDKEQPKTTESKPAKPTVSEKPPIKAKKAESAKPNLPATDKQLSAKEHEKAAPLKPDQPAKPQTQTPKQPVSVPAKTVEPPIPGPAQASRTPEESIRVSTGKLDILMEQVAELQTARINAEQRLSEVRDLLERVEGWDVEWRQIRSELWRMGLTNSSQANAPARTPVPVQNSWNSDTRSLASLSGFLESNANHLRHSVVQLSGLVRSFDSDSRRMAQVMADLQDGVRRIRMLPISTVFETFPRLVRDTARAVGKEVNFVIKGGENEVDRTILEQVKAPLVHLLRNAIDHGLESTEARLAAGKPQQGLLELSAAQRGANLQVEVIEDGGGINVEKVRESAVRKGLLSHEAAAAMTDQEAVWLIFRPGFSTKSEVTDLSGRGVGLDVVRENVEGLGGMIDVKSELGVGTTFTLTLPMSVATTLVMIVECGSRRFALPVTNILRIMQVEPERIGQLRGRAAIDFEGRPIALTHLANALSMGEADEGLKNDEPVQALIVGSADKRFAFLVDGVIGAQEVVVKSLLPPLDRVRRVAGATILGTGEVVMVVNVADLIRSSSLSSFAVSMHKTALMDETVKSSKNAKPAEPPLVLCVDDSFTTRTLVKSIVEAAGYRTKQAADGLEAWNILQTEPIELVVTDVNMPRMDGFELTRTIRKNSHTRDLPVILVTSLDSPEERAEGVDAGADAHIVKGALRQEDLLETIKRLI